MLPHLKRKRKDRRRLRTLDPARFLPPSPPPPPPPPPALVHVLRVMPAPGEPTVATWVFDVEIEDPVASLAGLTIAGSPGVSWVRDDPLGLRVEYNIEIAPGQTWSNTAGAGGIVGTDGGTLAAGSGTVQTP